MYGQNASFLSNNFIIFININFDPSQIAFYLYFGGISPKYAKDPF